MFHFGSSCATKAHSAHNHLCTVDYRFLHFAQSLIKEEQQVRVVKSPWDSGHAYHGGDTEQVSWQGMYSVTISTKRRQFTKTTGFDEEIHSAQTFEHKNRFQAIAVRNEDCVDDATTNMDNGKNISHRNLMTNSKHPAPKKIHTLLKAAKI